MLKYYVKRSEGEESFQRVTTPPRTGRIWVRGEMVTSEELRVLARHYDMNVSIFRDVLDKDELPRIEVRDDALYVFVRCATRGKHGRVITVPVLLAMKDHIFMNLTTSDEMTFTHESSGVEMVLRDTASLLLSTFAAVVSQYEDLMQHTARSIHDTSQRLRTHEVTNDDFVRFATVEDNLNEYKMNLGGMLVVAERLKNTFSANGDTEAVEDICLYIRQLLVAIDSYGQSITSIRNAYGTIANNVLNQRMKTLTVLTLLVALPNVFYGMYGMNIALPFANEPWAYMAILVFTAIVVIFVFVVARKKNIF
jgi:magnesium transporter